MLIPALQIIGGLVLLVIGADRFVAGAAHTARSLGVKPLLIGLTIVGISTSMPEVLVGSVAAWNGKTGIAVGNALGSNIANIGLVLGVTILVQPLVMASDTLRREFNIMLAAMAVAFLLLLDRELGRLDGALLLIVLAGALYWIGRIARHPARSDPLVGEYRREFKESAPIARSLALVGAGFVVLLLGADLLVRGAVEVATTFGVSDLVIGLTIVAVGTSLPELAASVASVLKNEADIAIGNVIGSNMFNMLMVLGIPGLIHPSRFGAEILTRDFALMGALTLLMARPVLFRDHGKFSRTEGGILLACFLLYQSWLILSAPQ